MGSFPNRLIFILVLSLLVLYPSLAPAQTINVGTAAALQSAVASANGSGGSTTIVLADGTYTLSNTLYINAPNVTITSQSGNRTRVVIQGDAMSATAAVGNLIRVAASNFTIQNLTLQRSGWHLIQIAGETNADSPVVRNVIFRDAYEQMLKVSNDPANPNVTGDNGIVENSLFEYTAGIGPQYYIGGIDAHGSKNWIIRGNTFRNIISPSGSAAEHAVHIWDAPSTNNLVEKNLIINCDRGIGFGLGDRGSSGGIIRNNMIYHAAGNGAFADVSIGLETSPNTQVYNNTIFLENGYPNAIEYRFPATTGVTIVNNLTNRVVQQRDGASGTVTKNVTNAASSWFVSPASGNLHLSSAISTVAGMGQAVSGLVDDFDSQSRPAGSPIDIGADQFLNGISARNNIFHRNMRVANSGNFTHTNNLYYMVNGAGVGYSLASGEKGNPMYVDLGTRNVNLQSSSPAIDAGTRRLGTGHWRL